MQILIVDDAQTDRELLARVVTGSGHQVISAADGKEALSLAKVHKPALIFLDVVMPNMDGFATCRALKKDPDTAAIPVVLVTTKGADSDKFWGKKQGADDHIAKPWTKDTIETVIRRFAGGRA
ncbi:MAG TPA: response regulator [Kofleriaceae bacterium]|nr:response regulator [Kofleriaceae bacterium]